MHTFHLKSPARYTKEEPVTPEAHGVGTGQATTRADRGPVAIATGVAAKLLREEAVVETVLEARAHNV